MSGKKKVEQGFVSIVAFVSGCWQLFWLITAWGVSQWGWNRPGLLPVKVYQGYIAAPAFCSWVGLSIIMLLGYVLFLPKAPTEHRWVIFGYALALAVGSYVTFMFTEYPLAGHFMAWISLGFAIAVRPDRKSAG